jgi:DNA-binding transcriptional ArsR family regulator
MLYIYNMSNLTENSGEDRTFKALANPIRRRLLDLLKGAPKTTGALCDAAPELDRCTVMQHLKVLEAADLLIVERRGRERWNHLNPVPIHQIHARWIGPMAAQAVGVLDNLKRDVEAGQQ